MTCPECRHPLELDGDEPPYRDADWLRHQYDDHVKSAYTIADEVGVSRSTIQSWLKKHGIERRGSNEGMVLSRLTEPANYRTKKDGYEEWRNEWDGERYHVYVHRLLAVAEFGFQAVAGKHVHHISGVEWDNRPDNLALMEKGDHHRHHVSGENNAKSILNENEVRGIRRRYNDGDVSQRDLAHEYGVSRSAVADIIHFRNWKHLDDGSEVTAE